MSSFTIFSMASVTCFDRAGSVSRIHMASALVQQTCEYVSSSLAATVIPAGTLVRRGRGHPFETAGLDGRRELLEGWLGLQW